MAMDRFEIRVVLADDHPGMLAGVRHELASVETLTLVGEVANSTGLMALLETTPCDVLVSDYAMPAGEFGDGVPLFKLVKRRFPDTQIVVMTMLDNPAVLHSLVSSGIRCIVSKSDAVAHLIPAIHAARTGGTYYSPTMDAVVRSIALVFCVLMVFLLRCSCSAISLIVSPDAYNRTTSDSRWLSTPAALRLRTSQSMERTTASMVGE